MTAIMGFLHTNLAAGLTPTATSSTTVAGLGWDKLNDPQPRHRARVAAASAILVWDLGSAQPVTCAALISTSIVYADTVRLRASTADPTCVGSLLYDSGVNANVTVYQYNGNVVECFASVTARYWRWDIVSANPIDIGLAPVGFLYRPAINYSYGMQSGYTDLSIRDRNPDTGAEFAVAGPILRSKIFTLDGLTKSETFDSFLGTPDRQVGAGGDVLFVPDSDASRLVRAGDAIWGSYRPVGDAFATITQEDRWSRAFRLTERL